MTSLHPISPKPAMLQHLTVAPIIARVAKAGVNLHVTSLSVEA